MAWQRTLIGALLGVLFVAMLIFTTLSQTTEECEVCVNFEGRTNCSTAQAASRDDAVAQALSSACAIVTTGVTEVVRCNRLAPQRITCSP